MALSDTLKSFSRELLNEHGAKTSLSNLEADGCYRKILIDHLFLLARPGQHKKGWYRLRSFSPDKLRGYPRELRDRAEEIEALNGAICTDPIYSRVIACSALLPKAGSLPPNWFNSFFGTLPASLRQYADAIEWIERAVESVAPEAAKLGRAKLAGLGLIYYVHLTTGKPHYDEVTSLIAAAHYVKNGEKAKPPDAAALQRRYRRSEYPRKVKEAHEQRVQAFRAWLLAQQPSQ